MALDEAPDSAYEESELASLLRDHAPRLHFDSLESLRPTAIDRYVDESGLRERDRPRTSDVTGLAKLEADVGREWQLDPLPEDHGALGEERSARLLAKYGATQDLERPGSCYGRAVPVGDAVFLQYWFFYVDNPYVVVVGRHDGDWEFAQVRVLRSDDGWTPTHLTLDQHGGPETRSLDPGTQRPDVYIAVGSHAAYFERGTQPRFPIGDECDGGRVPSEPLEVIEIPEPIEHTWVRWNGQWGIDRGLGTLAKVKLHLPLPRWLERWLNHRGVGDSPASPARQPHSWEALACYRSGIANRLTRSKLRTLIRFLGRATWPRAKPRVEVRRVDGEHVTISVAGSGFWPRRINRVAVTFEDEAGRTPLGSWTLRTRYRESTIPVPHAERTVWRAAGYNWLCQRGDVVVEGRLGESE